MGFDRQAQRQLRSLSNSFKLTNPNNMNWKHKVKIKHLLTNKEDYESLCASMTAISQVLKANNCFGQFLHEMGDLFDKIDEPTLDDPELSLAIANDHLEMLYDYCDSNSIWVE